MIWVISVLCVISLADSAPVYGQNGGYTGYASYNPHKFNLRISGLSRGSYHPEDSIYASAGSPDISRKPIKENAHLPFNKHVIPKNYDALEYKPTIQHGYGSNSIGQDKDSSPYAKATIYGQGSGGYKLADTYQNQHIQLNADKEHDYKDDHISYPQPYEYGYELKDKNGNAQHKTESSDGNGQVHGSYGFTDEHGLYRSVKYVADKEGFRASVKTNEPGTDNQNPADVLIETEQGKY